jgi:ATP-binding cassette subfamily B protein
LSQLLQDGLINAVSNLVICVGVAALLFIFNPTLAAITMLVVPPLLIATIAFRRMSTRAYDKARERIAAVNANLQETLSGVRVAQAFVRERENSNQFREIAGQHLDARLEAQRLQSIYFPFVEFLSVAAQALVLYAGAGLVRHHQLSQGALIAFLLYLVQFFAPIQQLSQVFDAYQQARAAMVKIGDLLATPSATPEAEHPVDPGRLSGRIVFDGVRFRYPNTVVDALAGIDLTIDPGDTVALVGETGAGKSTIVKLIPRFYDITGGRLLLDGVEVRDLDLGALRRQLGYVPQEPFLFSGTIRDNIAYGRPSASDADVEAASRAVGAHDFVAALPGGYHHPVSERGRSLSAGQRQLIALARARLVDPAVLLLDEATANLDLATEDRVNRAMGVVAEGRTTILIAHRLQTARRADRIVVIDAGRVVEQGTHDDLLARGGRYAAMWTAFAVETPA